MKKTIRTPAIINIAFLALLILPILVFLSIKQVSASPVKISYNVCDKVYYDTFVWQVNPKYEKMCRNRFQFLTNKLKDLLSITKNKYEWYNTIQKEYGSNT
jgi:hypothetical protein